MKGYSVWSRDERVDGLIAVRSEMGVEGAEASIEGLASGNEVLAPGSRRVGR